MTTSQHLVLAAVCILPATLLWGFLAVLLYRLRRRGPLPLRPLGVAVLVVGAAFSLTQAVTAGVGIVLPLWLVFGLAGGNVAAAYGYLLYQVHTRRSVLYGPWPDDPTTVSRREERRLIAEHYRAVLAHHNQGQHTAGGDAPATDETETP